MSRWGLGLLFVVVWTVSCLGSLLAGLFFGSMWDRSSRGTGLRKPPFAATALLRIRAASPRILPLEDRKVDWKEFEAYKQNVAALVKAQSFLNEALNDKSLQEVAVLKQHAADETDWLAGQIEVEFPGNGELMSISVSAGDKDQSRTVINAIAGALVKEVGDKDRNERLSRRDNLEKKLQAFKLRVMDKKRQLHELSLQIGGPDLESTRIKKKIAQDELETLLRQRSDLEQKIAEISVKVRLADVLWRSGESPAIPDEDMEAALSKDPRLQDAIASLTSLQADQRELERVVKDKSKDPAAARIRDAISAKRKEIETLKRDIRQEIAGRVKPNGQAPQPSIQSLQFERDLLLARLKEVVVQIELQAENIQKFEKFNGDAEQLRADIDQEQHFVKEMADALARSTVDLEAEPRVAILQTAN